VREAGSAKLSLEELLRKAARSIVSCSSCPKKGSNVLIICGKHNITFAEYLVTECYAKNISPHLWMWDENLLSSSRKSENETAIMKLPTHTQSLLENSNVIIWMTQFENPRNARIDLGAAVCSFWDKVYEVIKGKPLLLINLFSSKSIESMGIVFEKYLTTFANAVNIDYAKVRRTGLSIRASLEGKKMISVSDPNGTDLRFSVENRRVTVEDGTLKDCFTTGKECEIEIPAGEVYVCPLETSACGRLVVNEVRDFGVRGLEMDFKRGKMTALKAESGKVEFVSYLDSATGSKDKLAEFGVGINHGMKPIGLRISDEKALGTVHLAIGNNVHLGGVNRASIHIDFNLYEPTVKADDDLVMQRGQIMTKAPR
jgi:hypothetical protein